MKSFFGNNTNASLQAEVSRLEKLVEQRNKEREALTAQKALLARIDSLRADLGIAA